jgi:ribosomal protein S18 acetylase RimI-like enzyme
VYDVNPRAAAFYRRYGFVPTGRAETFHDDPRVLRLLTLDL